MGKPKGRNGFFQFLIHTQNQLKREGKNLGLNAPELQGIAGSQWSAMSKQEREPFEQKAKRSQSQTIAQLLHIVKYTRICLGVDFDFERQMILSGSYAKHRAQHIR
ncbi:unnamed protein product [Oppiella nova]|uniref:HMG box domain-containing protein n=1 Tax=Oppiella nova TaxID=334625 RepID=A0A7R9QCE1_9ACAR|nr:unnamed protein product [Oppiella nova]CAG2163078.1 unnamed protein product [Oppiella nova]